MKRFATVVLLLVLLPSAFGKAESPGRRTLKGLKKLCVLIPDLNAESQNAGLSQDQLKTDVELRLRRAHVRVADSPPADACLQVDLLVLKLSKDVVGWAFCLHVGVHQWVTLNRNKSISFAAETWSSQAGVGVCPVDGLASAVREKIGDQVDAFINDYLAENP